MLGLPCGYVRSSGVVVGCCDGQTWWIHLVLVLMAWLCLLLLYSIPLPCRSEKCHHGIILALLVSTYVGRCGWREVLGACSEHLHIKQAPPQQTRTE
jgi:hypothetical protein